MTQITATLCWVIPGASQLVPHICPPSALPLFPGHPSGITLLCGPSPQWGPSSPRGQPEPSCCPRGLSLQTPSLPPAPALPTAPSLPRQAPPISEALCVFQRTRLDASGGVHGVRGPAVFPPNSYVETSTPVTQSATEFRGTAFREMVRKVNEFQSRLWGGG